MPLTSTADTMTPSYTASGPTPAYSGAGGGPGSSGRQSRDTYLEATVSSASPSRLRLMVIERGVEVCRSLATEWREKPGRRGPNESSLRLLEILSELLSGVTDDKVEVCRTVADLYVFLCQHLISAEESADASMIDEIRLVLETEAETWRMVCAQEWAKTSGVKTPVSAVSGGLNLQG